MKGIVIYKNEKGFTFLKDFFQSIDNLQCNYNWLISGHECYPENPRYVELLSDEACWMTGEMLTSMIFDEDFQWIWGVLSAFPKEIAKEDVLKRELPKADGNEKIWNSSIALQHPLAEMEIIAWDSSMTVFISRSDVATEKIFEKYPLAEDLEEYNRD